MGTRSSLAGVTITRLEPGGGDGYLLAFKCGIKPRFYSAVAAVKRLPAAWRQYDGDEQAWWIYGAGLREIAEREHWPELAAALAEIDGAEAQRERVHARRRSSKAPADPLVPPATRQAFDVLYLQPSAPPDVVQAVYRVLARSAHPDAGGDHERMKAINLAYERARAFAEQHLQASA